MALKYKIIKPIKAKEAYLNMFFRFGTTGKTYMLMDIFKENEKLFFLYEDAKEFMPKSKKKEVLPDTEIIEMSLL